MPKFIFKGEDIVIITQALPKALPRTSASPLYVAGTDVGGTNKRVDVFEYHNGKLNPKPAFSFRQAIRQGETYLDADAALIDEVSRFANRNGGKVLAIGSSAAGIPEQYLTFVNKQTEPGWAEINLAQAAHVVNGKQVGRIFLNDGCAGIAGAERMPPAYTRVISGPGRINHSKRNYLATGTGLAHATSTNGVPNDSEGSSIKYGPVNFIEEVLTLWARSSGLIESKFGPKRGGLETEFFLSGRGLEIISRFVLDVIHGESDFSPQVQRLIEENEGDVAAAAAISIAAAKHSDPVAIDAMKIYAGIFGAHTCSYSLDTNAGATYLAGTTINDYVMFNNGTPGSEKLRRASNSKDLGPVYNVVAKAFRGDQYSYYTGNEFNGGLRDSTPRYGFVYQSEPGHQVRVITNKHVITYGAAQAAVHALSGYWGEINTVES